MIEEQDLLLGAIMNIFNQYSFMRDVARSFGTESDEVKYMMNEATDTQLGVMTNLAYMLDKEWLYPIISDGMYRRVSANKNSNISVSISEKIYNKSANKNKKRKRRR